MGTSFVSLLYNFALLCQIVLVGFQVNAIVRQPKRLKARVQFAGGIFFLVFETLLFAFVRGEQVAPWILPLALIVPFGTALSTHRLYRHWAPKYWDPTAPDFLGWNQP